MLSNVIECLKQNIRKYINCKRPSNTKQMNRVKNIRIEICKILKYAKLLRNTKYEAS